MEFSQPVFLYCCKILTNTGWYAGCTHTDTNTYNIATKDFKTFGVECITTNIQEYYFRQVVSTKTQNMTLDLYNLPHIVDEFAIVDKLIEAWNNLQQRFLKYRYLSTILPKDLLPLLLI